jgi:parallel beta-helix repeat protein
MKRFSAVTLVVALLFSAVASIQLFSVGSANPSSMIPPPPPLPRIFIRADGSIDPSNSPMQHVGNVYTLTASLSDRVIEIQCDNVVIDGASYTVTGKTYENGVVLASRKNVVVKNLVLRTFNAGIYLWGCTGCTVEGNTVTNSSRGIIITEHSKNNIIHANTLKDNMGGIYVSYSSDNQFRSNVMQGNKYNLDVYVGNLGTPPVLLSYLVNDIDFSNTVDGKPVCYWINQENKAVPSGCGCVVLIDCNGITVQNLGLFNNGCGVLLFATSNSTISQNTINGNGYGVWADSGSVQLAIEKNEISANMDDGISLVGSNDNRIDDNSIIDNKKLGIRLEDSRDCNVAGNTIKANYYGGIGLGNVSETTISGNHITDHKDNSGSAISLGLTLDSTISGNTIENNDVGLEIHDLSKNNTITGNTIRGNRDGFHFYYTTMYGPYTYPTSSNTFRSNHLNGNEAPLRFESSFIQDIDASNTVNGKPIYYWVDQHAKTVPSDAGYIALINCDRITVENVSITENLYGLMLFGTTNSLITESTFRRNSEHGIYVRHSSNNVFSGNDIVSNFWDGVYVEDSPNNTFVQNHVANNFRSGVEVGANDCSIMRNNVTSNGEAGIKLNGAKNNSIVENYVAGNDPGILLIWGTSQCKIVGNTITENDKWGMRIEGSKIDSVIHHNNFINNRVNQSLQISIPWPADPNVWDDGTEGNYWSDYQSRYPNTSEIASTGVGDTPFFINENNIDRFPLMKPIGLPDIFASPPTTVSASDDNSTAPNQHGSDHVGTNLQNGQMLTIAAAGAVGVAVASTLFFRQIKLKQKP